MGFSHHPQLPLHTRTANLELCVPVIEVFPASQREFHKSCEMPIAFPPQNGAHPLTCTEVI